MENNIKKQNKKTENKYHCSSLAVEGRYYIIPTISPANVDLYWGQVEMVKPADKCAIVSRLSSSKCHG